VKKYVYFGWTQYGTMLELFTLFAEVEPAPAEVQGAQRKIMAARKVLTMPAVAFYSAEELHAVPELPAEAAVPTLVTPGAVD
jgi:hypothetical protein